MIPKRERADTARQNSLRAKWSRVRFKRKPALPILGHLRHCWCGEPLGHDWPGKTEGAPHPR